MPENAALFAAIIANPREDTPRLAYADWLDENGDEARARFIRLQYEIEKLPPIGPKASKAKKEEEALLKKHGHKWAGEITELVGYYRFRRGFVELVRVTAASFIKHGGRLFELAPVREVRFEQVGNQMPALVASPHFGRRGSASARTSWTNSARTGASPCSSARRASRPCAGSTSA